MNYRKFIFSLTVAGVASFPLRFQLSACSSTRMNLAEHVYKRSKNKKCQVHTLVGFLITRPSLMSLRMFWREFAFDISVICVKRNVREFSWYEITWDDSLQTREVSNRKSGRDKKCMFTNLIRI
jgi:hypothetical protein